MNPMLRFWSDDTGEDLIEYALIAALISTLMLAVIQTCGTSVSQFWDHINGAM